MTKETSYAQILKSSSIIGGAAGIAMLLGMARTKFAALLIGTTGVGLLASFTSIQGLAGALFGLGIQSSAVREIASAVGRGDEEAMGRAVRTLRRMSWLTGLSGLLAMMALSPLISQLTFNNNQYTLDIATLGLVILFGNLAGGQLAFIQGMRRIGDMARANILGAILGTASTMGFYYWLGLRGVVPALVTLSALQLAIAWRYSRRVQVPFVHLTWRQTFHQANGMIRLGLVFMWNGLLGTAVSYFTIILISQQINLQAVGLYSAAFALSGIFVNFVLAAMSADYYPRLTSVAHDKVALNRLANEQTEIGLLLAVPGLLATMALAPWIIHVFYSSEFLPAVELLQWFILGCLGRVISWPLGYIIMALGKSGWLFASEFIMQTLHMLLIAAGLKIYGLAGVAIAFFVLYMIHIPFTYYIAKALTAFNWTTESRKLGVSYLALALFSFMATLYLPKIQAALFIGFLTLFSGIISLRGLQSRLEPSHRISMYLLRLGLSQPRQQNG